MARLSQEIILNMAEKIIYEKGMEKTTLYDIAGNLNVTHAALYKHYRNKEDLFQKLALRWLEELRGRFSIGHRAQGKHQMMRFTTGFGSWPILRKNDTKPTEKCFYFIRIILNKMKN